MTTQERLDQILQEQLGLEKPAQLSDEIEGDLDASSLDMASLQMAIEDEFGLRFAEGPSAFTDIDRAWEQMKTVGECLALIEKFKGERS